VFILALTCHKFKLWNYEQESKINGSDFFSFSHARIVALNDFDVIHL